MYYIVFLILLFFSIEEILLKRKNAVAFNIMYLLMTLMVIFRYGQLSDYFNYKGIYDKEETLDYDRDPLYSFISISCSELGLSYEGFVLIVGIFTMGVSYPFFVKSCKQSLLSLFIFYCYSFLILPMSGIRQGICLSLMLFGYNLLVSGWKKMFYVLVLVGCFIHLSMIAVLLISLFYDKKWYNNTIIIFVILAMTIVAMVTPDLSKFMVIFEERAFGADGESKMLQIIIRASLIIPVLLFKPEYKTHGYYAKAICIIGYCLYCALSFNTLVSSRVEYYFRTFLCLFASYMVFSEKKINIGVFLMELIVMVHVIIFFKNMNSFIIQGDYNVEKVNMFNFPYISIFDEDELQKYQ